MTRTNSKTIEKTGTEAGTKRNARASAKPGATAGALTTCLIRELPLAKLVASDKNVRRTNRMVGIEELAASIAAHGLLQSLSVMPVLNAEGEETGKFRVCGGGRRLAALQLLAKRRQITKDYLVPCLVSAGNEEEASLAENVVRENLHPADQFEAFKRLADEHGLGAEDIAARFGVTPQVVRQRMRLGAISPRLMQEYREGSLDLNQLMAFALTDDHPRQEAVFDRLSYNKDATTIRRMLTETNVPAQDRRALFVGEDAYQTAGGTILRDLFNEDRGGYFEDAALLDRLASEKLAELAASIRAEGWKWAEAHIDYPHAHGLKRVYPFVTELTDEEQARCDALSTEQEALTEEADASEECPEPVLARLDEIEAELAALRAEVYAPEDIARCGVFVVLNYDGTPRIERGYLRPEDQHAEDGQERQFGSNGETTCEYDEAPRVNGEDQAAEEDETAKPLSDLLIRDLTAHRTLGLRLALGDDPDMALVAVTHALAAQLFYRGHEGGKLSCLEIKLAVPPLASHADGIEDSCGASTFAARHEGWARQMPKQATELWGFIVGLDADSRMALFAHCAASSVFAVELPYDRMLLSIRHADALAEALSLDMSQHWQATARSYFGRVTKAHILDAVRESLGEDAAEPIAGLKKPAMAEAAEGLLAGRNWLPEPLRTVGSMEAIGIAPAQSEDEATGSANNAEAAYAAADAA